MPLFICFCPDYPNSLDKRLKVRAEHLELGKKDREAGKSVFGRAFTNPDSSDMVGSTMIYRYPTLDAAWARIKADPYRVDDVWDKEKVTIKALAGMPGDETLKMQ